MHKPRKLEYCNGCHETFDTLEVSLGTYKNSQFCEKCWTSLEKKDPTTVPWGYLPKSTPKEEARVHHAMNATERGVALGNTWINKLSKLFNR